MQDLGLRALANVFLLIVFPSLVVSEDFHGDETLASSPLALIRATEGYRG